MCAYDARPDFFGEAPPDADATKFTRFTREIDVMLSLRIRHAHAFAAARYTMPALPHIHMALPLAFLYDFSTTAGRRAQAVTAIDMMMMDDISATLAGNNNKASSITLILYTLLRMPSTIYQMLLYH